MPGVLLVMPASGEQITPTMAELASEGRRVADALGTGTEVTALLVGKNLQGVSLALGGYGIQTVLLAQDDSPLPASPEWLLAAAEAAARQVSPQVVLLTHTDAGRGLGPRLAFRLNSAAVTDSTRLRVEGGQVVATKPVYGGSAIAEMVVNTIPAVFTLRPRAFEAAEPAPAAGAQAQVTALTVPPVPDTVQVLEEIREEASSGPRLKDAKIVVSGGRGVGGPDNWKLIDDLAQVLGAAQGASRAVTDAGWVPPSYQVGLTGTAVAPDLYLAIGISGAVQHVAGISGARNVVAINRDGEANIFKYARYGVVGDLKQVVPAFTERLRQLRS